MSDIATTICNQQIFPKVSTKEYGDNVFLMNALDVLKMVREYISQHPCDSYEADVRSGLLYINGDFVERIVPMPSGSVFSEKADYYEDKILARSGL